VIANGTGRRVKQRLSDSLQPLGSRLGETPAERYSGRSRRSDSLPRPPHHEGHPRSRLSAASTQRLPVYAGALAQSVGAVHFDE
jgi:hypothetical protein